MQFRLALSVVLLAFTTHASAVTIDTVLVGDAGNAAHSSGFGAVSYNYRMGTYEVTNSQYVEFLNAKAVTNNDLGLYSENMTTNVFGGILRSGSPGSFAYSVKAGMGNKPVNFVSLPDTMRFANWLSNGQGAGSTEIGAYTFAGNIPALISRNPDAQWFLPSVDEWYKAAYYEPTQHGGDSDSYWLYPTRSNDVPTRAIVSDPSLNISNPGINVANYDGGVSYFTSVGTAGPLSASYYGTYDQGGNIAELMDTFATGGVFLGERYAQYSSFNRDAYPMGADVMGGRNPLVESFDWGFRVATIPEPSTVVLAAVGLLALAGVACARVFLSTILRSACY